MSLDFIGTAVEVVYTATPESGTLVIEIDGEIRRTVDTAADDVVHGEIARIEGLADDLHNIRIYSLDGPVAIDTIRIE
jgi:hypothetical protein